MQVTSNVVSTEIIHSFASRPLDLAEWEKIKGMAVLTGYMVDTMPDDFLVVGTGSISLGGVDHEVVWLWPWCLDHHIHFQNKVLAMSVSHCMPGLTALVPRGTPRKSYAVDAMRYRIWENGPVQAVFFAKVPYELLTTRVYGRAIDDAFLHEIFPLG